MPQDSGGGPSEPTRLTLSNWRVWITSPRHVPATIAAVAVLGFALGYLIVTVAFLPSHNVAAGLVRVPDLIGLLADDARPRAERAQLDYHESASLTHAAPLGTVLAQEPLPGQLASPGSEIEVTVSAGPQQRPVPDVVGLHRSQAEVVLARAGFTSDFIWVDADNDVGQVVSTRPEAGAPLEVYGNVRLIVSAGARTPDVPDLTGSSLQEARSVLERVGLRLGEVTESADSLAAPGTVLGQSPQPGSLVDRGTAVAVVVAVAAPQVEVEDTTGVAVDTLGVPADSAAVPEDTTTVQADTATGDSRRDES